MTLSARGLAMMDQVYGPGFSEAMTEQRGTFAEDTVNHLFADVWSRPGLTIRELRLLVLGATAALGRSDLVHVQVRGALANDELDAQQLDEMVAFLAHYVGWGNATQFQQGVAAALADHDSATTDSARTRDEDAQ
ncbi:carboxymuconolactone decarboxylase family protein [Brachybacterium sp. ACRRE]|uniref:carboxymuconolactone decarboxylase family protein n=1 Tax=Brachybacterium sp. ACRRE TaxID=2918184 RepID=UPI001EF19031|nr:carboxymuconolactone decarboxylase family protein [Brachybacterium sp. ACRRE]MCG7308957.1 carboxymuconolactone decarboxylase family protein [Brachybacterium sp. ACRRE]